MGDEVLVRVLVGHVGDLAPDTGSIIRVTADVAADLVGVGEAVPVKAETGYGMQNFTASNPDTARTPSSRVGRKWRISEYGDAWLE